MERGAADLACPFRDIVRHSEDLLSLLIQQEMVIAKVIPTHVPVEVFGLEIERKYVRQQSAKRIGNLFNRLAAEASRCGKGLVCWICEFHRITFSHSGSSFQIIVPCVKVQLDRPSEGLCILSAHIETRCSLDALSRTQSRGQHSGYQSERVRTRFSASLFTRRARVSIASVDKTSRLSFGQQEGGPV